MYNIKIINKKRKNNLKETLFNIYNKKTQQNYKKFW